MLQEIQLNQEQKQHIPIISLNQMGRTAFRPNNICQNDFNDQPEAIAAQRRLDKWVSPSQITRGLDRHPSCSGY